jgi:hypothetical protein
MPAPVDAIGMRLVRAFVIVVAVSAVSPGLAAAKATVSPRHAAPGQEIRISAAAVMHGHLHAIVVVGHRGFRLPTRAAGRGTVEVRLPATLLTGRKRTVVARVTILAGHRMLCSGRFWITLQAAGKGRTPAQHPTTPTTTPAPSPPTTPIGSPTLTAGATTGPTLAWAPPALTDPTTIPLVSGEDPDVVDLNPEQDYVLQMPAGGIHGTVEINGGHNVVLIGGEITVPSTANQTDNGEDDTDTALYIRDATGTVHIEGVLIDADPDVEYDGIDVNAPQATVQIENVRVENVWGSENTEHADVIQTWGGVKDLRVDRLTANGDYQGLTIDPDLGPVGSAEIENVDLTDDPPPPALAATTIGGGYMIWLTSSDDTCDAPTTTFESVFIDNLTDRIADSNTMWPPSTGTSLPCAGTLSDGQMTWPDLPVTGAVTLGTPPGGPFVPSGVAGLSYQSPGYTPDP